MPTVDELLAFLFLVRDMRDAQREFFNPKARRPDTVSRAKKLERQVDTLARELAADLGGAEWRLF